MCNIVVAIEYSVPINLNYTSGNDRQSRALMTAILGDNPICNKAIPTNNTVIVPGIFL